MTTKQKEFLMHLFDDEKSYKKVMDVLDHFNKWGLLTFTSVTELKKSFATKVNIDENLVFSAISKSYKDETGKDCSLSKGQYEEMPISIPTTLLELCALSQTRLGKLFKAIEKMIKENVKESTTETKSEEKALIAKEGKVESLIVGTSSTLEPNSTIPPIERKEQEKKVKKQQKDGFSKEELKKKQVPQVDTPEVTSSPISTPSSTQKKEQPKTAGTPVDTKKKQEQPKVVEEKKPEPVVEEKSEGRETTLERIKPSSPKTYWKESIVELVPETNFAIISANTIPVEHVIYIEKKEKGVLETFTANNTSSDKEMVELAAVIRQESLIANNVSQIVPVLQHKKMGEQSLLPTIISEMQNMQNNMNVQLQNMQNNMNAQLQNMQTNINVQLQNMQNNMNAQLQNMQNNMKKQSKEIRNVKNDVNELKKEVKDVKKTVVTFKNEIVGNILELKEDMKQMKDFKQDMDEFKNNVEGLKNDFKHAVKASEEHDKRREKSLQHIREDLGSVIKNIGTLYEPVLNQKLQCDLPYHSITSPLHMDVDFQKSVYKEERDVWEVL